jgi:hypothetical protein
MISLNRFLNEALFSEFFQIPSNDVFEETDYRPENIREKQSKNRGSNQGDYKDNF